MDALPLPPLPVFSDFVQEEEQHPFQAKNRQDSPIGRLTILNGQLQGSFYPLTSGRFTFGCTPGNDFLLPAMANVAKKNHFTILLSRSTGETIILPGDADSLLFVDDNIVLDRWSLHGNEIITAGELKLQWMLARENPSTETMPPLASPASPAQVKCLPRFNDNGPSTKKFLSAAPENTKQANEQNEASPPSRIHQHPLPESRKKRDNDIAAHPPGNEKAILTRPTPGNPRFLFARINRIGDREEQQDASAGWANRENWFGIVTDGAGGHVLGGVAAKTAIAVIESYWQNKRRDTDEDQLLWLVNCLKNTNTAIVNSTFCKGRATIAALYIRDTRFYSAHLGDTRIYQIRDREIIFRTKDDSVARILCDQGEITEEEIATHPGQSRLFKALGDPREIDPNLHTGTCCPGDLFLLCSDGFWTAISNEEIISELSPFSQKDNWTGPDAASHSARLKETLESMTSRAVAHGRGKSDNVSAMVVICSPIA